MTPNDETTAGAAGPGAQPQVDPQLLDTLWDFDDPAASEQRFRAALGPPATAEAELRTQLARAIGLQGRYDEATAELDAVDSDGADGGLPNRIVGIRLALERGRVLNSSGDPAASIRLFAEALAAAESAGEDFLAVDAAHMLAIADRDRAEHWTNLALRMVAHSQDPRTQRWAGSLHNNAGWARLDAGDFATALAEFQAAQASYAVTGTVEQVRVAQWAVARALRSLARFEEALAIQHRLAEHGQPDGYVQEELAELLLATGQPDEARRHAQRAVELLGGDSRFAEYESGRLERLRRIAEHG